MPYPEAHRNHFDAMEYRNIVAILVIVYYSTTLVLASLLVWRHGFKASWETWLLLATFSTSRIVYGAIQLSTIADPESIGLQVAAAIWAIDGLAGLYFCSIGLLKGILERVAKLELQASVRRFHLRVCELLVTAAFICASIGYSGLSDEDVIYGMREHPVTSQAAAAMYIVALAMAVACTAAMLVHHRQICRKDQRTLLVLVATQPLLAVRVIYLALDILGNLQTFSVIRGSVTAFLLMALSTEAAVLAALLVLGYTLPVATSHDADTAEDAQRLGSADTDLLETRLRQ